MGKKKIIPTISWDQIAFKHFIKILDFISEDSVVNAKRVKTRINNIIKTIPFHPYMFKEDDWRFKNDGSFRVFVKNRIRVSYQIRTTDIRIIRISHTSEESKFY
jgi:plasmid stabilization system protein ParE